MKMPRKLTIANLPTNIEHLKRLSSELGNVNIYLKRDDQTGTEVSGNKIRKLEFAIAEAIDNGYDTLITCGAVQSNHARATAAAAAKIGTFAGLLYANTLVKNDAVVYGINISADREYFAGETKKIIAEMNEYTGENISLSYDEIPIIDGYAGRGYGLSTKEEIDFIKYIASLEGVALDPVYTGKAFYGLYNEIKKGNLSNHKNILFIHTGGIFGWKAEQRDIIKNF